MTKQLEQHNKILMKLFSDLPRFVRINNLVKETEYNWRTIKHHLEIASMGYKERKKLEEVEE